MNYRGSTGYGRAFWEKSFKQWGRAMQDDITDGVNWLIQEGIADRKRIGIYLVTVTIILLMVADSTRFHKMPVWYALGYPLVSALFVYIMLRTMTLNILQGGIYWRGTFYPLKELKKNQV